jgi:hypothetical protein
MAPSFKRTNWSFGDKIIKSNPLSLEGQQFMVIETASVISMDPSSSPSA